MADNADFASDESELIKELQIQALRAAADVKVRKPKGECHYCEEPFPAGDPRVFCDTDCAEDQKRFIDNRG